MYVNINHNKKHLLFTGFLFEGLHPENHGLINNYIYDRASGKS